MQKDRASRLVTEPVDNSQNADLSQKHVISAPLCSADLATILFTGPRFEKPFLNIGGVL